METASDIVAKKFSALRRADYKAGKWSVAERAMWLIITMRCEIDMGSFAGVFEQTLKKSEVEETIGFLKQIEFFEVAEQVEGALNLLVEEGVYEDNDFPQEAFSDEVQDELMEIQERIGDQLWSADDKLLGLLNVDEI